MKNELSYTEEYIDANGLPTYTLCYSASEGKPLLLYLHGGPGESTAPLLHVLAGRLRDICALATYDQRGAGRTYLRTPSAAPDTELMLGELRAVIAQLKHKYNVERVALLGHSWGSVLGSLYAQRHPEDLLCYIGVGQVVDMVENEQVGYRILREHILAANNEKHLALLDAIGKYPDTESPEIFDKKIFKVRKLQRKYGLAMKVDLKLMHAFISGPTFKLCDLTAMSKSLEANIPLSRQLMTYSLYPYPRKYGTPVFYILGDRDYQTPFEIAQKYLATVDAPAKRVYMVENAGHVTPLDNPDGFAAALKAALDTVL